MTRESFNRLKEQLINNIESLSNHSTKVDELNCYSALVTMLNDTPAWSKDVLRPIFEEE